MELVSSRTSLWGMAFVSCKAHRASPLSFSAFLAALKELGNVELISALGFCWLPQEERTAMWKLSISDAACWNN